MQATYDITQSYDWNYANGPIVNFELPESLPARQPIDFLGFRVNSPLGVPAGPLLNANWIKFFADCGWDMPIYKTVRSRAIPCHQSPNIVFVHPEQQLSDSDAGGRLSGDLTIPDAVHDLSITNSFGVPSKEPQVWQADVELANSYMGDGQVMIVSCMGTASEDEPVEVDYARTAAMAVEAGAKIIEVNYSCPNLASGEGSIYADSELSSRISKAVREAIGNTPLLIKMGNLPAGRLEEVVLANAPWVDGYAGINTVQMHVSNPDGSDILPNRQKSGICGSCIQTAGLDWTRRLSELRTKLGDDKVIVGCGGVMTEADIDQRLSTGADIVMSATAAMWDPLLAARWRAM